jgi:hypothetical protein
MSGGSCDDPWFCTIGMVGGHDDNDGAMTMMTMARQRP